MVIITQDHKARGRTARQHICTRFLPPSVSRLVLLYLLHVRPFMATLVPVAREHSPRHRQQARWWEAQNPAKLRNMADLPTPLSEAHNSYDLFTAPGSKSPRNPRRGLYGRLLQESSYKFFSHAFHALTYRHLIIAITRKHLKAKATVAGLHSAAATIDSIFTAQAGHSTYINRQIYSVEESQPLQPVPEMLHLYRYASHQWHQFILAPVEDPRPAPVSRSLSLPSPRPEQPPPLRDQMPQHGVHQS
jgi:hypothetical protein